MTKHTNALALVDDARVAEIEHRRDGLWQATSETAGVRNPRYRSRVPHAAGTAQARYFVRYCIESKLNILFSSPHDEKF